MNEYTQSPLAVAPGKAVELETIEAEVLTIKLMPVAGWRDGDVANPALEFLVRVRANVNGHTVHSNIRMDPVIDEDGIHLPEVIASTTVTPTNGADNGIPRQGALAAVDGSGKIALDEQGRPIPAATEPAGTSHLCVERMVGKHLGAYLRFNGASVTPVIGAKGARNEGAVVVDANGVQTVTIRATEVVPFLKQTRTLANGPAVRL